jgi:hypothetical protein
MIFTLNAIIQKSEIVTSSDYLKVYEKDIFSAGFTMIDLCFVISKDGIFVFTLYLKATNIFSFVLCYLLTKKI